MVSVKANRHLTSIDIGKDPSFLFVDDDPNILKLLSTLFAGAYKNARIYLATENKEAIDLAVQYKPDLIISDIKRPGADGYQFLAALRSNQRTRHIPVFSLTGTVSPGYDKKRIKEAEAEELRQYRAGFNRVIAKPFQLDQLIETANSFIVSDAKTDHALLNIEMETPTLDYKESVDLSTGDGSASLAKDVIAMANAGGGTIIIGVAEKMKGQFERVGLSKTILETLETTLVNKSLRSFMAPSIYVGVRRVIDEGKTFIFLQIPGAEDAPVLAKKNNQNVSLYQGRIYIRNTAAESREITDYLEFRQFLDRFRGKP